MRTDGPSDADLPGRWFNFRAVHCDRIQIQSPYYRRFLRCWEARPPCCKWYGDGSGLDVCGIFFVDGWIDRVSWVRWVGVLDGLDWWVRAFGRAVSPFPS